ncbi:MAG: hypothetical protein NT151_04300 [Acidobacteria bacterium]|nr:hypothetical protein [Acidobacteriota bacterium]
MTRQPSSRLAKMIDGSAGGQAVTEYVTLLGLLATLLIFITSVLTPVLGWLVVRLVQHMSVYMTGSGP